MGQNSPQAIKQQVQADRATILLIYDSEGKLVAESNGARQFAFGAEGDATGVNPGAWDGASHTVAAPGQGSDLMSWVTSQIDRARKQESHRDRSTLEHPSGLVDVKFETLSLPGKDRRYAVLISQSEDLVPDGSSVITRQQWHDIKNHLGGLKLYATFMKKKTSGTEDQVIVEKLLNGINGLINHLAQIRGGDSE
jgi:hypothetical protein